MTEFLDTVAEVWRTGVLGVSLGDVVSSLLVLLIFLGLRRAFFRVVLA